MLRLFLFLTLITVCACYNKVRLKDVTVLTLYRDEYTTGRRSVPVRQLKCIGGTAKGRYEPNVVQCYNRGFDGLDVQWECKAELKNNIEFGKVRVTCEGYNYPEDPYVLKGSCGLEYELDYTDDGESRHHSNLGNWIMIGVVCFIFYLLYTTLTAPREGREGDRNRGSSGDSPPYPPGSDRRRPPPPPPGFKTNFDAPPPTYEEACYRSGATDATCSTSSCNPGQQPNSSGLGFFSGLGLGSVAGYLFGRSRNNDSSYTRDQGTSNSERDTGFSSNRPSTSNAFRRFSSSNSSSGSRTKSGYGGTVRR